MTHSGSCTKTCGHLLDTTHVKANPETQRELDRDPRVVEYSLLDDDWFEVVYAPHRSVPAIYRANAASLGLTALA